MARAAFADALKLHTLQFELLSDECVQIHAARDDISADGSDGFSRDAKFVTDSIENLRGKKSDLALVITREIKKAVAFDAASGDTFDFPYLDGVVFAGRLTVMAEKIMPRRNKKPLDPDLLRTRHMMILSAI